MITKEQFEKRIEQLCKLEKGWMNGEGETFNKESFNSIKERLFDANDRLSVRLPYLYPSVENNMITLEWEDSIDIHLNLKTNKIIYCSVDGMEDKEFDLDEQWDFILNVLWEGN